MIVPCTGNEGHDDETLLQIGFLDECLTVVLGGSSCLRASPRWIATASERSPRLEFLVWHDGTIHPRPGRIGDSAQGNQLRGS